MTNVYDQLIEAADAQDKATAAPWTLTPISMPDYVLLQRGDSRFNKSTQLDTEDAHFIALCRSLPLRETAALVEEVKLAIDCHYLNDIRIGLRRALAALEAAAPSQGDGK